MTAINKFMPWTYPTSGSEIASILSTVLKISIRLFFSVVAWYKVSFPFEGFFSGKDLGTSLSICWSCFAGYLMLWMAFLNF
jgi:hypothetical protein